MALGFLSTLLNDIITRFNAHIASTVFHFSADAGANVIANEFRDPRTAESIKRTIGVLLRALNSHIRNDSIVQPQGTGSHQFHVVSSVGVVDWASIPLFESTSTISEHVRAIADLHRAFESHRTSAAHLTPDTTNVLTALPPLLNVHAQFLTQIAALSPAAPITDNSAKTLLVHGSGFEDL